MTRLEDLLIKPKLPHKEDLETREHEDFSPEIRNELNRKLSESARNLIDPRGLL